MNTRFHKFAAAALLGALLVTGCVPTAMPTPTPSPAPVPVAYAIEAIAPQGFAAYKPVVITVKPQVSPYEIDLSRVANADLLARLSPQQRVLLEQNGFVVVPSRAAQIYDLYKQAKEQNIPVFVTTDALLHTFHILYDYTLRTAEIEHFVRDLQGLNTAMLKAALGQYQAASGKTKEAALKNVAYFAVASRLLDPQAPVPREVKALVAQELALIREHAGFADSPIFGYREDYSQYVPRGHYTRNKTFERYFKAMMWYGRLMFRLRPGQDEEAVEKGREETRQAILIVLALQKDGEALAAWERIYEPTAFFVGRTDDLNVYDYSQALREVYGEKLSLSDLEDDVRLDDFIARVMTLRPPKIVSSYVTDQERPEEVTKGFRFMGQRFIPDSYIFQQLVYDKVGTVHEPRLFPKGLDVLAALGSERAYEILDQVYGETRYAHYEEQMARLRDEFSRLPPEQWTENLYWNWLHALRPLLEPRGQGYPTFMRSQAWTDKQLFTALGSWTELRHDTILYAKQSYTLKATGLVPQPEPTRGYVEPNVEVWARLAALTRQMRDGLGDRGLLNEEYKDKLDRLESLLLSLKAISEKELAGQALTEEEYGLIRNMGGILEGLTTFSVETAKEITSEADERMAIVADVHTDVNSGQVLEEGVGDAFLIYVVVPVEEDLVIAQGGVFSYYEFLQPMDDRLTDEAWQAMEPRPDLPPWTASFIR
ncbi:MAG: DUF3160 domain-containing protein [Anaerolineae bacterium]